MVGYLTGCGGDDEKTTMRARAPPAEPRNPPRAAWVSRRRHAPRERWKTTSRRPTQNLNPTARGARGGVASARSAPRRERHTIRRATLESTQERGNARIPSRGTVGRTRQDGITVSRGTRWPSRSSSVGKSARGVDASSRAGVLNTNTRVYVVYVTDEDTDTCYSDPETTS